MFKTILKKSSDVLELISERERMAFAQEAGKIGIFDWDLITDVSVWNKEFEKLYGYEHKKFPGKNLNAWTKLVHPIDRDRVLKTTTKAISNPKETKLVIEFRIVWPDKSTHHLITRAKIIRNNKGKAIRIIGVNLDITARKQTEANLNYLSEASKILASSLDYNKTLASVVELGVPELADWCTVDMLDEKGAVHQLAIAHVDPKQVKWAREYNKRHPPRMDTPTGLPNVLRTGKSEIYPHITVEMIEATVKDKRVIALLRKLHLTSIMIVPLTIKEKTIGALTFISTQNGRHYDQSTLKIAEEVATRAALAIDNARLFTESQKAIALRDEFISIASHELKTPVASLKMYTQIIYKQLEQRGETLLLTPLSKMDGQLERLNLLIEDLLNVSKLQLGKLEFHEDYFDLKEVIIDVIEGMHAHTKKHTITVEGTPKKKVWGDKYRIGQVVTNLLSNAAKYSPGADKIKVVIESSPQAVKVRVIDFGIGINKEHLNKIFERFYRVTGPDERTFPGLGIGLYISSQIIKRHGGTMNVKSAKGKGSEFSFTLPYKKS